MEANRDRPFLLSVQFRAPHTPYGPVPEEDLAPYQTLDPTIPEVPMLPRARVKELYRAYYASISPVDRNVGRLLERLDGLGLASRTIVIFSSDNGYMIGQHGLWHKGNGNWLVEGMTGPRPNMFEESIRVPLIVRWPGKVAPGTVVDRVVSSLDLFPTILEMAGLGVPKNLSTHGRSLVPLLRGAPSAWDDTLFGQYDMHHYVVARMRMIRTPESKLIRHFEPGGKDELYHLAADPGESTNLAGSPEPTARRVQGELTRRLDAWMKAMNDPIGSR